MGVKILNAEKKKHEGSGFCECLCVTSQLDQWQRLQHRHKDKKTN